VLTCLCFLCVSQILDRLEKEGVSEVNTNVGRKFGYVVSCQVYGKMKMNQDSKVHHQLQQSSLHEATRNDSSFKLGSQEVTTRGQLSLFNCLHAHLPLTLFLPVCPCIGLSLGG
jgi:hypothetical protein